ncbi:hypothetical protein IKF33_01195 [Candidatus Saccharibacteria bacterium]|nr:hypothetical protein [Candidatus Saccharibacteria bacterium]
MQTDFIVNVKDSSSDNPVVPETDGNSTSTSTSSPNTGFLTVDGSSNHGSNTNTDPFFLLGILGITMFIAMAVFLIIEKLRSSKNPQATESVVELEDSIITNFSQHLPRDLAILVVSAAAFSFVGLSYSHFFYDTTVNAGEDTSETDQTSQTDTLSITASSTSKIEADLKDGPAFAYFKDTITVTSSTESGYTLTANIIGSDKDLVNISNPEASDTKITGLDSTTSPSSLTDNTWGISLTKSTSKDDSIFYGLPTDESTPFTIVNKNTATEAGDTTDIYYGTYITSGLSTGTYSGVAIEYTAVANVPPTPAMQEFDSSVCANATTDQTFTLRDHRDDKEYTVAKLRDGNCWMTQNLALGGAAPITLTPADTNIASDFTLSASITEGNWVGYLDHSEIFDYAGTHPSQQASNKYGNLYNWFAATAGTNPSSGDSVYDICPKNWHLPSAGTDSTTGNEFYTMIDDYIISGAWHNIGWFDVDLENFINTPVSLVFSGTYDYNLFDQGMAGYWWSSTAASSNSAHNFSAYEDGFIGPRDGGGKSHGNAIRCLMSGQ